MGSSLAAGPGRPGTGQLRAACPSAPTAATLARALDQLTDLLWAVEIGEVRLPARPGGD
jgi:hypothetical protein